MLDKMKDIGSQAANKASDALGEIKSTLKDGVGSISSSAGSLTESLNEKAVRASTAQVVRILEIAIEELQNRPISTKPISLTASVNLGIAALEMQVHLGDQPSPSEDRHIVTVQTTETQ